MAELQCNLDYGEAGGRQFAGRIGREWEDVHRASFDADQLCSELERVIVPQ